ACVMYTHRGLPSPAPRRGPLDGGVEQCCLRERQFPGAERREDDPEPVPEYGRRHEEADAEKAAREPEPSNPPPECGERGHESAEKEPGLEDVPRREEHGLRLVAVGPR